MQPTHDPRRLSRDLRFLGLASILLAAAGCSDREPAGPPSGHGTEILGTAIRLHVDVRTGQVTVAPPLAANAAGQSSGFTPSFALLGRNEVAVATSNFFRSAVGEFTPFRVRVRFDVGLTNNLLNADLVPSSFPAPPSGVAQVMAFPFATDPSGLFGLKVRASTDWDGTGAVGSGTPHNFFNDAVCITLTPPSDCFRWEAFGARIDAGSTTAPRTVGFDIDPSVSAFTVYVVVAADIRERSLPALISVSDAAPLFTGVPGGENPPEQQMLVTNAGGGTLDNMGAEVSYKSGQPAGWLTATLSATAAPATLTLRASQAALAPGQYLATVTLSSPAAMNSPVGLPVSLIVAPPLIALSGTNATFLAAFGGPNPTPQHLQVTSRSGVEATGLALNVTYGGERTGWLGATLSGGTTPATLTLAPKVDGLPMGEYSARVDVTSATAGAVHVFVVTRVIGFPDLQFIGTPGIATSSAAVSVTNIQITNQGFDGSGPFLVAAELCVSPSPTPAAGDCGIAAFASRPGLDPSEVDVVPSLTITSGPNTFEHIEPGTYYVLVSADPPNFNEVIEADETNNLLVLGPIEITAAPPSDVSTIRVARDAPDGTAVRVEGLVTAAFPTAAFVNYLVYLQDESAGIAAFPVGENLPPGTRVQVSGTRSTFGGETQISVSELTNLGLFQPPSPRPISSTEIRDGSAEGELVVIQNLVVTGAVSSTVVTVMIQTGVLPPEGPTLFQLELGSPVPPDGTCFGTVTGVLARVFGAVRLRTRSGADAAPGQCILLP